MSKENESKILYTLLTAMAVLLIGVTTFAINTFARDQGKLEDRTTKLEQHHVSAEVRLTRIEAKLEAILEKLSSSPCTKGRKSPSTND